MKIKRKTPIKRSEIPIRREGASTLRWKKWRSRQRAKAKERAGNKCEYHSLAQHGGIIEWNHLFGRHDEPWSSYYPFTQMMCLDVHRRFHVDAAFRNSLQWKALGDFLQYDPSELEMMMQLYGKAINLWNFFMVDFKKQGVLPPDDAPPKENRAT